MAAYAHHARRLGQVDEAIDDFVERALFATVTNVNFDLASLFALVLECGEKNLRAIPPNVFRSLQDRFDLRLTGEASADLSASLPVMS